MHSKQFTIKVWAKTAKSAEWWQQQAHQQARAFVTDMRAGNGPYFNPAITEIQTTEVLPSEAAV
jgi:hypothetical protein